MKNITKYRVGLLLSLTLSFAPGVFAKVSTAALDQNVRVQAFDTANGIWYLGTAVANGDSSLVQTNAVFDGSTTPTLTALATNDTLTGSILDKRLAISHLPSTTTAVLAFHNGTNNLGSVGLYKAGTALPVYTVVKDGAGADITAAADIRDIALSPDHVFVATDVAGGDFGAANSGIRSLSYNTALVTGDAAFAQMVNTSHWIDGNCTNAPAVTTAVTPVLCWHPGLSRLYCGITGSSNATAANDIFVGLSCWYNAAANSIDNVPLLASLAGTPTAANVGLRAGDAAGSSSIIGAKNDGAAARNFSIKNLAAMTTSTGKHYIIVNGGLGTTTTVNAKIFALPLCDTGDATDIGALAKVTDTTNGIVDFGEPADSTDGTDIYKEDDVPAIVGGAALPILVGGTVEQMTVVGDTVYCGLLGTSTSGVLGTGIEAGIMYSQAIFNNTGAICGWTDWAKAAPNTLSGTSLSQGACFAFAIDAARGRIWTVDNADKTVVHVNQWTRPTALTTPGGQLNGKLTGGCYSAFLLGQHLTSLGNEIVDRFILVGGDNQVVVMKTGIAGDAAFSSVETPTPDWTAATVAATNLSTGLEGVGPVTALGWMGESGTAADNFLLAGTNKGLYAFASSAGAGFDVDAANIVGNVNHASSIWQTYQWYALTAIDEPVVKIVNIGHADNAVAFVLTHGKDGIDKIWKVAGGENTTVTLLNADIAAIGTTGLSGDSFANIKRIYDIELISQDGQTGTTYELVASTDLGLFISTDAPMTISSTAATSNWTQITDSSHIAYHLVSPLRTRQKQMVWGVDQYYDASTGNPQIKTKLSQLAVNSDSTTRTFTPAAGFTSDSLLYFNSLNRATAFYSNGAFRFMGNRVVPHSNDNYNLMNILPYNVGSSDWNMTALTAIPDAVCLSSSTKSIYWIADVAGYTLAGTDDGVIELG